MAALVRQNNAVAIAQRLALSSADTSKRQFVDYMKTKSYAAVLSESERVMSADWAEVVCHAVKAAIGVHDKNLMEAYTHQEASVEAFLRIFKSLTRQWLPVLKQLLIDLRRLGDQVRRPLAAPAPLFSPLRCVLRSARRHTPRPPPHPRALQGPRALAWDRAAWRRSVADGPGTAARTWRAQTAPADSETLRAPGRWTRSCEEKARGRRRASWRAQGA